jgi:hypothetical protein
MCIYVYICVYRYPLVAKSPTSHASMYLCIDVSIHLCIYLSSHLHIYISRGLVWTDLKLDNFILQPKQPEVIAEVEAYFSSKGLTGSKTSSIGSKAGSTAGSSMGTARSTGTGNAATYPYLSSAYTAKAADLESAVRVGAAMRDFSPEGCAPEHAASLGAGQLAIVGGMAYGLLLPLLVYVYMRYAHACVYVHVCVYGHVCVCMQICLTSHLSPFTSHPSILTSPTVPLTSHLLPHTSYPLSPIPVPYLRQGL